ncbi:MAG: NAD-dependent epimerase/dehydratase family protein [Candidatus Roizmanbacteria bacterium]
MHILITGGAGFLGSHLAKRLLKENHKVTVIDNFLTGSISNLPKDPDLTVIDKDVCDISYHSLHGLRKINQIYHLASPASPNHHSPLSYHALPMETMMVNTTGTLRMLELAEIHKAKFLFTSTSEVYGDPLVHPQTEDYNGNVSTTGPRSVYDEAKRFGETLTAYHWRDRGLDARIVRIFNTFGPQMSGADMRMIINFIQQALRNDDITIFGDGTQTRSLCYVDDTIDGIIRLMNKDQTKGEVVNIGSTEEHTVTEYAHMVKKITGSSSTIVYKESLPTHDPKQRKADITKAKRLLDWSPTTPLEEGLSKTVEYVQVVLKK